MGSVFVAERADGEVEQRVAIKILRGGADDPGMRDRFLQERQVLAALEHPGIARMVDAGQSSDGHPYFAMEFVEGTPIDVYAATLDLRGKLELFLQVCEAVSYAHRNLIIHRDLKPSNILVDGTGRAKLLDFGIASVVEEGQGQSQTGAGLLTPEYASPEQLQGGVETAATDIYSLGIVLRKLLAGSAPADLQFVIGKALRAEPEERYASADALAEDVRAFLECRPVRARSGSQSYRLRTFVRRRRLPVVAAGMVLMALFAGLLMASRERNLAVRRFAQVRQFTGQFIDLDVGLRGLPGATQARARLVSDALEHLAGFRAAAWGDRDLAIEIAMAYLQLARIQGVPLDSHLGQFAEAEQSLGRAEEFVRAVLSADGSNGRALALSAEIAWDREVLARMLDGKLDARTRIPPKPRSADRMVTWGSDAIGQGPHHSLELRADGTVWAWGSNSSGQLGDGSHTDSRVPVQSKGLSDVISVAAGGRHSLALKADGTVWAWGFNSTGQVGVGSRATAARPVQEPVEIPGLHDVVAIAAGGSHSLAVKADGSVWAWGYSEYGQLGTGTNTTDNFSPARVAGLAGAIAVAAGEHFSLALKSDGSVWAWGRNREGQLGDGTNTPTNVPVWMAGLSGVTAMAAGRAHGVALTSGGTLWTWGSNSQGQLGNGNRTGSSRPIQIPGVRDAIAISAAGDSSVANLGEAMGH